MKKYYVTMTDKFMSGWGKAQGKKNKLIIECENYEQASIIERNAKRRNEMKFVNICSSRPRYGSNVYESWKTWEDMGDIWKR